MLVEEKADRSLERIMEMAEDELLKAKTAEEKEVARQHYKDLHKIYNERLRIQNDRYLGETDDSLDTEKFEAERDRLERELEAERKAKKHDRIIRLVTKGIEFGLVGTGIAIQAIMLHNNVMEFDNVSKGTTKSIVGKFGDYLRGV